MKLKLKSKYIQEIRNNQQLKMKLQVQFGYISEATLRLRLNRNSKTLTEYSILLFLSKELGAPIEELLEPDKEAVETLI